MSDGSKIEWLARPGTKPATWNPVTGCSKVSEGCTHCYAERIAKRLAGRFGYPADEPFRVTLHPDRLEQPLRWNKPRTVFVCSMSDLFHEDVSDAQRDQVFALAPRCPQHTFLILTKRADRMHRYMTAPDTSERISDVADHDGGIFRRALHVAPLNGEWPSSNMWLGVTIEQPRYSWRAQYLRETPATIRFLSLEPLLASMDDYPGVFDDMDWVIVGGESGPGARPMHPDWVRGVRDQCQAADVPFFMKQMSKRAPIPGDLMVREFPNI